MSKDWTGTKESKFRQLGATNHSKGKREKNDFYATDPVAIDYLLKVENFSNNIWECAVGKGHLAQRLIDNGFNVKSTDIIDRGFPDTKIFDFVNQKEKFNGDIVTNPPFKYLSEFILNALESIEDGNKVAMFLKIQTLEGQKRYEKIYKNYPPKTVYVFSKRIKCMINGDFEDDSSSAVCYGWFVWEKGKTSVTELKWLI